MKFTILSWLVSLLIPIALIGLALRVLLSPLFLQIEYNLPYFPADPYGFTKEDRLKWAPYALDYLLNNEDISYLGDLEFDDGTPLYNERELSHMDDVKFWTQTSLRIWYTTLALLLLLGVWAWFGRSASASMADGGGRSRHWIDRRSWHCHRSKCVLEFLLGIP
jgi:hypothetical protein